MTHGVQAGEWRRYGFGGPPEPWPHGAQRDLDRLATSYYLEILDLRSQIRREHRSDDVLARVEDLYAAATRHKHEIDYTLRHWATPVERARVEDRLGSLMRISRQMRSASEPTPRRPRPVPSPDAA